MNCDMTKLNPISKGLALAFAMALTLIAGGVVHRAMAQEFSPRSKQNRFAQQGSNNAANAMFSSGRDLIDDAQWAKAEQKFGQYVSAYPKEKNADAAMYWMAYSQYKLKKFDQCKDTIARLLKTYEKTTWKEDEQLLLAQVPNGIRVKVDPITVSVDPVVDVQVNAQDIQERVAEAQARVEERVREAQARAEERTREAQARVQERMKEVQEKLKDKALFKYDMGDFDFDFDFDPETFKGQSKSTRDDDPCEFKIVVLQALFENDAQRGIAAATEWLRAGSTEAYSCKRAALGLLARHGGKAATPTILGIAEHESDLKLRTRAISVLGSTNDDSVIDPLREFALNSPQTEVSEAALYALSQHSSPRAIDALSQIATSNKPVALRKMAISNIANRQGEPPVDALLRIYDADQSVEIRKSVISGFGHRRSDRAGAKLLEIARGSDNVELRKAAISGISRRGGDHAIDTLLGLYDSEKNEELKDQIIYSLGPSNDPRVVHKLIEIARNPQTPIERRKHAIAWLSRSKDPEVLKFLEDLLKQ